MHSCEGLKLILWMLDAIIVVCNLKPESSYMGGGRETALKITVFI